MRKSTLAECNAEFRKFSLSSDPRLIDVLVLDCPEGHADCRHHVPFEPQFDGSNTYVDGEGYRLGRVSGDTIETLTLAQAAGVGRCPAKFYVRDGKIEFCEDSR